MAHPGGRPLKFQSIKELKRQIDAYFAMCDPHPEKVEIHKWHTKKVRRKNARTGEISEEEVNDYSKPPIIRRQWQITHQQAYTITGLAVFLDTSRRTLVDYEERDDEFSHTIKTAKNKIEEFWELQLLGAHATGPIFNLKNNYQWQDKTETDITTKGEALNTAPDPAIAANFAEYLKNQKQ
jgi:hypothetical protein